MVGKAKIPTSYNSRHIFVKAKRKFIKSIKSNIERVLSTYLWEAYKEKPVSNSLHSSAAKFNLILKAMSDTVYNRVGNMSIKDVLPKFEEIAMEEVPNAAECKEDVPNAAECKEEVSNAAECNEEVPNAAECNEKVPNAAECNEEVLNAAECNEEVLNAVECNEEVPANEIPPQINETLEEMLPWNNITFDTLFNVNGEIDASYDDILDFLNSFN